MVAVVAAAVTLFSELPCLEVGYVVLFVLPLVLQQQLLLLLMLLLSSSQQSQVLDSS